MPNPGNPSVIVDDRSTLIKYAGQWGQAGIGEEFQGTTSTSHTAGSTATFTFDGTSIVVYGTMNPDATTTMGFAIDKTITGNTSTPATLPAGTDALLHQALYTSPTLPAGSHTLVITHSTTTPGDHIFLDYLVYIPSPNTDSAGLTYLVDDNDSRIQYTNWKPVENARRALHTQHQSGGDGSKITLPFEGTQISLFGDVPRRLTLANMATISIDNGPATNFAPPIQIVNPFTFNQQIFNSPKLTQANHTLVLTTIGADALLIDYFLVTPGEITRPTPSISASTPASTSSTSTSSPSSKTSTSTKASASVTPSQSAAAASGSTTKVAAIAGGSVGGIIFLALLFALFIVWRKRRADKQDTADLVSLTSERYAVQPFTPFTPMAPSTSSHAYPPSQPPSQYTPSVYQAPSTYGGSNHAGDGAGYANQQAAYPAYAHQQTMNNTSQPAFGMGNQDQRQPTTAISEKDPRYRPGPPHLYQPVQTTQTYQPAETYQPAQTFQSADISAAYDGYEAGPSDLPYASPGPSSPGDQANLPNPHDSRPPPTYTLH